MQLVKPPLKPVQLYTPNTLLRKHTMSSRFKPLLQPGGVHEGPDKSRVSWGVLVVWGPSEGMRV